MLSICRRFCDKLIIVKPAIDFLATELKNDLVMLRTCKSGKMSRRPKGTAKTKELTIDNCLVLGIGIIFGLILVRYSEMLIFSSKQAPCPFILKKKTFEWHSRKCLTYNENSQRTSSDCVGVTSTSSTIARIHFEWSETFVKIAYWFTIHFPDESTGELETIPWTSQRIFLTK